MTKKPDHLPPRHTAIDALRLMRDGGYRHVPVVHEGVVLGIVSRGDSVGWSRTGWTRRPGSGSGCASADANVAGTA